VAWVVGTKAQDLIITKGDTKIDQDVYDDSIRRNGPITDIDSNVSRIDMNSNESITKSNDSYHNASKYDDPLEVLNEVTGEPCIDDYELVESVASEPLGIYTYMYIYLSMNKCL
jgi:hypothetical protein